MAQRRKASPVHTTSAPLVSPAKKPRRQRRHAPPLDQLTPWARSLKRLMEERGVSQQTVADETGIDKNTLSAIIHGRHSSTKTLAKVAQYFDVPLAVLFVDTLPGPGALRPRPLGKQTFISFDHTQTYLLELISLLLRRDAETRAWNATGNKADAAKWADAFG